MFTLYADKNALHVRRKELLTSGSQQVNTVHFDFSPDWDALTKTAVFKAGGESFSVLLAKPECSIPWEALAAPGRTLYVGIYGTQGEEIVLPTIWASLGEIQEGASPGEDAKDPTPSVYDQIMAELADTREQTGKDASTAKNAADRAENAANAAGAAANKAETASRTAADARDDAERYSELAQTAANESGYFFVEVQKDGCLHFIRSENSETIGFQLQEGELIAVYA